MHIITRPIARWKSFMGHSQDKFCSWLAMLNTYTDLFHLPHQGGKIRGVRTNKGFWDATLLHIDAYV